METEIRKSQKPEREMMEEDERREAAIAASPSLQPNFKSVKVTHDQLNKFKELHHRRLQITEQSKKKLKGSSSGAAKQSRKKAKAKKEEDGIVMIVDPGTCTTKIDMEDISSLQKQQDKGTSSLAPKKQQKLHWGLDTKERWERKANM